jgi:hypothetical protein
MIAPMAGTASGWVLLVVGVAFLVVAVVALAIGGHGTLGVDGLLVGAACCLGGLGLLKAR